MRIFALTQAGREEFVLYQIAAPQFFHLKQNMAAPWARDRLNRFCLTANQTQKDALCTASGQAAGCLLCN